MKIPARQSTLKLTHYGRRSGKPFDVTIWFADIGGELWIGTLDTNRNWVRNVRAGGRARIDFGDGPIDVIAEPAGSEADNRRFREAVTAKYPVMSRVIGLFVRNKTQTAFRLRPA